MAEPSAISDALLSTDHTVAVSPPSTESMRTSGGEDDNICRDFFRGVCQRGVRCKYNHPTTLQSAKDRIPVCRDFQNGTCSRSSCKYMHITLEEERHYVRTGQLPQHISKRSYALAADRQTKAGANDPVCKDFLNSICNRGSTCKFRHVDEEEWEYEKKHGHPPQFPLKESLPKRHEESASSSSAVTDVELLQAKNADLQRQVTDLRAMNDILYEQNLRFRAQLGLPSTRTAVTAASNPVAGGSVPSPTTVGDPLAPYRTPAYVATCYDAVQPPATYLCSAYASTYPTSPYSAVAALPGFTLGRPNEASTGILTSLATTLENLTKMKRDMP